MHCTGIILIYIYIYIYMGPRFFFFLGKKIWGHTDGSQVVSWCAFKELRDFELPTTHPTLSYTIKHFCRINICGMWEIHLRYLETLSCPTTHLTLSCTTKHFCRINICGMWQIRVKVLVFNKKFYTHICLN